MSFAVNLMMASALGGTGTRRRTNDGRQPAAGRERARGAEHGAGRCRTMPRSAGVATPPAGSPSRDACQRGGA